TLIGEWISSRLGAPPILNKSRDVCRIQLSADSPSSPVWSHAILLNPAFYGAILGATPKH
ncbi:MAG: hypothetical protein O6761_03430, partial [Thaumarchaeota archaeon]|nr:hypothetical protein [Nitrososphaerota archaeon]